MAEKIFVCFLKKKMMNWLFFTFFGRCFFYFSANFSPRKSNTIWLFWHFLQQEKYFSAISVVFLSFTSRVVRAAHWWTTLEVRLSNHWIGTYNAKLICRRRGSNSHTLYLAFGSPRAYHWPTEASIYNNEFFQYRYFSSSFPQQQRTTLLLTSSPFSSVSPSQLLQSSHYRSC